MSKPQVLVIKFQVTKALYHEGGGGSRITCNKCGDRPKRYIRLMLEGGGKAYLCPRCYAEVGGATAEYDDTDWDSCHE
jgi:hypothetical protein